MGQKISELPVAGPLQGSEKVPVVQEGQTRKATIAELRGAPPDPVRSVALQGNAAELNISQLAPTLVVVGTLTGTGTLTLPDAARGTFTITNKATGAYSLTVKTTNGTGVVAAKGYQTLVTVDSTGVHAFMTSSVSLFDVPFWRGGDDGELDFYRTPTMTVVSDPPNHFGRALRIDGAGTLWLKGDTIYFDASMFKAASNLFTLLGASLKVLFGGFTVRAGGSPDLDIIDFQNYGHNYLRPSAPTRSVVVEPSEGIVSAHSTFHTAGSLALGSDTARTLATTLTNLHYALYFNTSGGNITQALPDANGIDGREHVFFKATNDANTLTIEPVPGQGVSTILGALDSTVTYRAFNGRWRRVSQIS